MPGRLTFPMIKSLATAALVLIYTGIGVFSWQHNRGELEQSLQQESDALRITFEVALSDLEQHMLTLATMVAADPKVQDLFRRGRNALDEEGGGTGGPQTARLRDELYEHVSPSWIDMQQQFGLRQLHFQFGPGALSYLRVHTPGRYGDRMDGLRHIIEDVNRDQRPRTGFETGRIYSGVRGVVPVWHPRADGTREYIGALEAGTSFNGHLTRLDGRMKAGLAVLLKKEHIEDAVWEPYRPLSGPRTDTGCGCYLEAASRDEVRHWMSDTLLPPLPNSQTLSILLPWQGRTWHLTRFPLRDYLGKVTPERQHVGSVLIWRDRSAQIATWQRHQLLTLGTLLLAYLLTQGLLLWLLRGTRDSLQQRVNSATTELSVANERLDLALRGADLGLWDWHIPSGRTTFNTRWSEMLGYAPGEIPPHVSSWEHLVHPDDKAAVEAALRPHLEGLTPLYESEHRMRHRDGHWVWILDRGKVMERAADGSAVRALGTHLDITARKEAEARLRESEALLLQVQTVAHIGSWHLEAHGDLLNWSAETCRIFGLPPDTTPSLTLFFSFLHADDRAAVEAAWQAALQGAPYDIEHRIEVNGETRWVRERAELVFDEQGALLSALGTVQDVTHFKQLELERLASEARYRTTFAAVEDGLWEWDVAANRVSWDERCYRMLGYEPDAFAINFETWQGLIHPDDVAAATAAVQEQLARGETFIIEFRYRCADGHWLWVQGRGKVVEWRDGQQARVVGTHSDISARKRAEEALRAARARLHTVIEHFSGGILLEDENRRIALINQTFCTLFGIDEPPEALIGTRSSTNIERVGALIAHPERFACRMDELVAQRSPVTGEEIRLADRRALERDYLPVISDGALLGHLWVYRDITERKQREQELHRLASTDLLTGLPNRRHFLDRTKQELTRVQRTGGSAALLMIDLDHFKRVNDQYGHATGDAVLRHFADLAQRCLRRMDVIGRLGGEEFAVLLPGVDSTSARQLAERLRTQVADSPCKVGDASVPLTISIGLTLFRASDTSADLPLARADAALYRAKQNGRNRVEGS